MSDAEGVVVDTMVISWPFDDRPNPLGERYRALSGPRPVLLALPDRDGTAVGGTSSWAG